VRTASLIVVAIVGASIGAGTFLYARNATPTVPALATAEAAAPSASWVVKLHAQWCPVCMLTKAGPILVLDGRSKSILAWINGSRDFADYRAAIDSALATAAP
jgi:uncharacterized protein (UPF0333 family)